MLYKWHIVNLYKDHPIIKQIKKKIIPDTSKKQVIFSFKGPYIKYVRGEGRVFVGAMKYFRHILMGHEIFFKIFDGP